MTRLPRVKGKEVVRILEKLGFRAVRTRGSHVFSDIRAEELPRCRCILAK